MMQARIVFWLIGGGWRWVAGAAVVLVVAAIEVAVWNAGYEDAAAKCEAATKQAQIDKLQLEIKAANAVAEGAQETIGTLRQKDLEAQRRQQELDDEIGELRKQIAAAPTPAQKVERKKNALVNSHCDLTRRGVQFFTR